MEKAMTAAASTPQHSGSASVTTSKAGATFRAQTQARWELAKTTAAQRVEKLRKIHDLVDRHREKIHQALKADLGRAPAETEILEISPTLVELNHAIRNVAFWMRPRRVPTPLIFIPARSEVWSEPRGVTLVLGPWNYPFALCVIPVITAICAGCPVVVKPSELAPATSRLMFEILNGLLPEGELTVLEGGVETSKELLDLPFDHFFYTGGGPVGKIVMQAAAKHLSAVTLELGGKSPVILDDRLSSFKDAASKVTWGKFVNAGQTCVAPDYVLAPKGRGDEFGKLVADLVAARYGSSEAERKQSPHLARIVNARHFERIRALVEKSVAAGAKVVIGGVFDEATRYIAPTVLTGVKADHAIMGDEIFGPVLPILEMDSLEDAMRFTRTHEKPLALYLFSDDESRADSILAGTTAGGSCVNDVALHLGNPHLPFGGVGPSGLGAYHGEHGFRAFSHERAVFRQSRLSALPLLYPPYGPRTWQLLSVLRKLV